MRSALRHPDRNTPPTIPRPGETPPVRIPNVDAIRGLALSLILFSNIQEFALPRIGYFYPSVYGDFSLLNRLAWHFDHLLCNEKSLILFGLLFGAGLFLRDRSATEEKPLNAWVRRSCWLLAIGLFHAYLVWDGDILVTLSLCGLAVYSFRRRSGRYLFALAVVSALVLPFVIGWVNAEVGLWDLRKIAWIDGPPAGAPGALEVIINAMRGGFLSQMSHRVPESLAMHSFVLPYHLFWFVSASMLLGIALARSGFILGTSRPYRYVVTLVAALCIGLPLTHLNLHHLWLNGLAPWRAFYVSAEYEWWAALVVALGWIASINLLERTWWGRWPLTTLATFGRMSLSNYIGQSILGTAIFYGHGLGLFGRLDRMELMGVAVAILTLQISLSHLWLAHFEFGPLEYLIRYRR